VKIQAKTFTQKMTRKNKHLRLRCLLT